MTFDSLLLCSQWQQGPAPIGWRTENAANMSGEKQMKSLTRIFPLALLAGLIFVPEKALAFGGFGGGSGWCGLGMGGGPMGWFGMIVMVLFWAVVVWAIIALMRGAWRFTGPGSGKDGSGRDDDRAMALLRESFARGEIDEAEFNARKRALDR
ncbi:SHOCT domain-containing protein [Desulfurivibrio sp. D14AmB]|uniref:SHOCT domain-containing protein n=1 Tax=Desulfurivibrio sp. D14AmB TaxID=3374370 RepID=UPI00376EFF23